MPYLDAPLSENDEAQFYGTPISEAALEHGQQSVIDDMELVAELLTECEDVRSPCAYFGPISTPDLVRQVLLNKDATDAQLVAAAREFRTRLLVHHSRLVNERAGEAMA